MGIKYEQIMDFMTAYFEAYSTLAQQVETVEKMHDYYLPELRVTQYFPVVAESDREQFLRISSAHPAIQETLKPEHIIVDERQHMAGVLLRGEFTIKETGEVIVQMFTAHYHLVYDHNNTLKIKNLFIFAEYVAPGKQNIIDLYEDAFKKLKL